MLIKKELKEIPVSEFLTNDCENKKYYFSRKICNLKRSKKILVIDIFLIETKNVIVRFFYNRKNYFTYFPEDDEWSKKNLTNAIQYSIEKKEYKSLEPSYHFCYYSRILEYEIIYDESLILILNDFLNINEKNSYILNKINNIIAEINNVYKQKQQREKERAVFYIENSKLPLDIKEYCEKNILKKFYILIDSSKSKNRTAVCTSCGKEFEIDRKIKHKSFGVCPYCKKDIQYYLQKYQKNICDKEKICVLNKINDISNDICLKWIKVKRQFKNNVSVYNFEVYYATFYIWEQEKIKIFSYCYSCPMYWGWEWRYQKNSVNNRDEAHLYISNLVSVFQDYYFAKDLEFISNKIGSFQVSSLFNKKNLITFKILISLELTNLAKEVGTEKIKNGKKFHEILGISKQYMPLFRKYNVTAQELELFKSTKKWISEKDFLNFRKLIDNKKSINNSYLFIEHLLSLMDKFSFEKLINYYTKQKILNSSRTLHEIIIFHKDYLNMCNEFKISLNKNLSFPQNIIKSHDILLLHINEMFNENIKKTLKQIENTIYNEAIIYQKDNFIIIIPKTREQFIKEGQMLGHCVGGKYYFDEHIKGNKMVFFVRKKEDCSQPFFTLQIDMINMKILQVYGKANKQPPADVQSFINSFLNKLKNITKEKLLECV